MARKTDNPYRKPDRFTQAAKEQGYAARSVFKLSEVDRKHPMLRPGMRVVDLGCFPGSWSRYVLERVGRGGKLVGVDLSAPELPGGHFLARSVFDVPSDEVLGLLGGMADVVLSDMAPNTVGVAFADHVRQMELARAALRVAIDLLTPGGVLFLKIFDGEEVPAFQDLLRKHFTKVARYRPEAVRNNSREFFLMASGFRGRPAAARVDATAEGPPADA
jgi:23S rRNA (uridine2552-2'-O)-methyltransferase